MSFYDGACTEAYVATESDFPYRPTALLVMDGLINACVAVRGHIDSRLAENTRLAARLPVPSDEVKNTDAGKFLQGLTANTPTEALDKLIVRFDGSPKTIEELKAEEALLRSADMSKERQRLSRQAEKLDALCNHLRKLHSVLCDNGLTALQESRDDVETLQEAANVLAQSFESEPLSGVGSSPWKVLWESARRFSEEQAYPDHLFPVSEGDSRCVLCQQTLDTEARNRLSRFESFVKDDTQTRLGEARRSYEAQADIISKLDISPEVVEGNLRDIEPFHTDLIKDVRTLLGKYKEAKEGIGVALTGSERLKLPGLDPTSLLVKLTEAATGSRNLAEDLDDPRVVQQRLAEVVVTRQELELLQQIKNHRREIITEIRRLQERQVLEAAKSACGDRTDHEENYGVLRRKYY